jgi:hypothetical protein
LFFFEIYSFAAADPGRWGEGKREILISFFIGPMTKKLKKKKGKTNSIVL